MQLNIQDIKEQQINSQHADIVDLYNLTLGNTLHVKILIIFTLVLAVI